MRKITDNIRTLFGLAGLVVLVASCSQDGAERPRVEVELMPCTSSYLFVEPVATRAWTPPADYHLYSELNGMFDSQANLVDNTIGIYFTQDAETPEGGTFFKSSDDKWRSTVDISTGTYYLYGYIPHRSGITSSISPNSSYSNGAVLTLTGMPTVTNNDFCVVVGAKEGTDEETVPGLTTGQFAYEVTSADDNYIFLLFDHIYSALRIRIAVDEDYDDQRTVKLKALRLKAYNGSSAFKSKTSATITLAKTDDGSSPITSITFTPDDTSGDVEAPLFQNSSGLTLTTDFTDFRGCFIPNSTGGSITDLVLESTYDVYDKSGTLTRADCTSENKLSLSTIFGAAASPMARGKMYTVSLLVKPSYLYRLSDTELDNPSFTITE